MQHAILHVLRILSVLFACTGVSGQSLPTTCQGSLGDPKVNITFGSGPGFGPALEAGVTTYQYIPAAIEHDGQYTLASDVNHAKPDWHHMRDHTGDENGYMLVVNASNEPGEFYRSLVSGLCVNTDFEFSAWITNANTPPTCAGNAKRPNVLFRIEDLDGTPLAEVATGDIEPSEVPRWDQYGFTFNTGDKTDFYVVMINNNEGGCGNDLAIDDITFRACGPRLEAGAEGLGSSGTLYACPGTTLDIHSSISTGFVNPLYQWQIRNPDEDNWTDLPGENSTTLRVTAGNTNPSYRLVAAGNAANLASEFCRVFSNAVTVTTVPPLTIGTQPQDISACLDENPFIEIGASGGYPGVEYHWESSPDPAGPWTAAVTDRPSTPNSRFYPAVEAPGVYYYRCVLSTEAQGCGTLTSRVSKFTVLPPIVTLDLPVTSLCIDDAPLQLSGGLPLQEDDDKTGVYSGSGVQNGYFDPVAAGGPGTYEITYTLRNTTGCQYIATDFITVQPPAGAEAGPDKKMLAGTFTTLEGAGKGVTFSWSPAEGLDDPAKPNPRASPAETTLYTLTVTTAGGCTATDLVRVEVLEKLIIPSAFTPNHDGMNDTWEIQGIGGYPEASVKVFNRWGTTVFYSRGYPVPWDGTTGGALLPGGAYFYVIVPGIFLEPLSGSLTIIR